MSAALLAPVASAQEGLVGGYVLDLAEAERLAGGVQAKTFWCPMKGSCVAAVRIEIRGEAHDHVVFAEATATTATVRFLGRDRTAPDQMSGSSDQMRIPRAPDGTGSPDAALTVPTASPWYTSKRCTLRVPLLPRPPLANLHVTVRR